MEWIKANLWEIKQSPCLRFLGVVLSLSHVFTFLQWYPSNSPLFNSGSSPALCWSFIQHCSSLQLLSSTQMQGFFITYALFAVAALFCFLSERAVGLGWFLLLLAFFAKTFVYLLDFQLAANIHGFLLIANFFYLFIPQKRLVTQVLVLLSYLTLGGLKLNPEWLAGYWLSQHVNSPAKMLEWIAAGAALVELVVPWGLFSKATKRFYSAVSILVVYHLIQWLYLGFFQPAISILLIAFFVLAFSEEARKEREAIYQSFIRPEPSKGWVPVSVLFFALFQLLPLWLKNPFWQDNPLRYRPRPVPVECQQFNFAVFDNGTRALPAVESLNNDLSCHTSYRLKLTQALCNDHKKEVHFLNIATFFHRRRISQGSYTRVFENFSFCGPDRQVQKPSASAAKPPVPKEAPSEPRGNKK